MDEEEEEEEEEDGKKITPCMLHPSCKYSHESRGTWYTIQFYF